MVKTEESQATKSEQFPEEFYSDPRGWNRYVVQEKTLFGWLAPSKVEKNWQGKELRFFFVMFLLITILLLLFGQYWLTFVLVVAVAVLALLATTKPTQLQCSITTIGIKVEDKYYYWDQLTQFWFEEKSNTLFLYLRDVLPQPHNFRLISRKEDEEKIKTEVGKYLLYKKPHQTRLQKLYRRTLEILPFDLDLYLTQ